MAGGAPGAGFIDTLAKIHRPPSTLLKAFGRAILRKAHGINPMPWLPTALCLWKGTTSVVPQSPQLRNSQ